MNQLDAGVIVPDCAVRHLAVEQDIGGNGLFLVFRSGNREPPAMSQTVSDVIVQRPHQWGVRHIFGSPGDGINGVFGAMNRADGKIGFAEDDRPARHLRR